jgi:cytidine deaminase
MTAAIETTLLEVIAPCAGCGQPFSEFVRPNELPGGVCEQCEEDEEYTCA